MTMKRFTTNLKNEAGATRRETFDGVEHLVVPVVMIVDGVLNNALVTHEEYGRYVESWNGRPVPVLHPEERGQPISANRIDVLEKRVIGYVHNSRVDEDKLKAELWINLAKANKLGFSALVERLEAGEVVEVSTGYFSDSDPKPGEYNGKPYAEIHRNIRPDHLALLPGEIGACSVEDGCGTRVNAKKGGAMRTRVNEAINTLMTALGLKANSCTCNEEEQPMNKIAKLAEKLKANEKITAKQFDMLMELDDEQRAMVEAVLAAAGSAPAPKAAEDEELPPTPEEEMIPMKDVEGVVANAVSKALAERDKQATISRLVANSECDFTADELKTMSVSALEKLEKSLAPADYSGAGGFATNSTKVDGESRPLTIHRGVLARDAK